MADNRQRGSIEVVADTTDATQKLDDLEASVTSNAKDIEKSLEQGIGDELERITGLITEVEQKSRESLGEFADRSARTRVAIGELREQLDRLGDEVQPELTTKLDKLETQFEQTFTTGQVRAGKLQTEIDSIDRSTRQAQTGYVDLTDAIQGLSPKAAGAIFGVASAVLTLKESFNATRGAVDFLKEQLGVDLDGAVSSLIEKLPQLNLFVEDLANFDRIGFDRAAADAENLANQINILTNEGVKFEQTAEGVAQAFARWTEQQRTAGQRTLDTAAAMRELREQVAGISTEAAQDEIESLATIFEEVEGNVDKFLEGPLGEKFTERLEAAREQAELLGLSIEDVLGEEKAQSFERAEEAIDRFRQNLELTVPPAEDMAETLEKKVEPALQKVTERVTEFVEAAADARKEIADIVSDATKSLKEADKTVGIESQTAAITDQEKAVEALRKEVEAATEAQTAFTSTEADFQRLQAATANLAAAEATLAQTREQSSQTFFQSRREEILSQEEANALIQAARDEVRRLADAYGQGGETATSSLSRIVDTLETSKTTLGTTEERVKQFEKNFSDELKRLEAQAGKSLGGEEGSKGVKGHTEEAAAAQEELAKGTEKTTEAVKALGEAAPELDPLIAKLQETVGVCNTLIQCMERLAGLE